LLSISGWNHLSLLIKNKLAIFKHASYFLNKCRANSYDIMNEKEEIMRDRLKLMQEIGKIRQEKNKKNKLETSRTV